MNTSNNEDLNRKDRDISLYRQRLATEQTARYVELHMRKVQSVSTRFEVHTVSRSYSTDNGLILEFGVFQGRTINFISNLFPSSKIFGFDSFQGLPEDWCDGNPKGVFAVNSLPTVPNNVTLIPGLFCDTLPRFADELMPNMRVSYLHIDCDLYSSAKTIFECLKPFISSGTVIVFDEYFNYPGWKKDEFLAFKEFIAYSGFSYEYICYNRLGHQVSVRIKLP